MNIIQLNLFLIKLLLQLINLFLFGFNLFETHLVKLIDCYQPIVQIACKPYVPYFLLGRLVKLV